MIPFVRILRKNIGTKNIYHILPYWGQSVSASVLSVPLDPM